MVAGHLVRPYLSTATLDKVWSDPKMSNDCSVSTLQSIWASYVFLDGVRYAASLSNEGGEDRHKLLDAAHAS